MHTQHIRIASAQLTYPSQGGRLLDSHSGVWGIQMYRCCCVLQCTTTSVMHFLGRHEKQRCPASPEN